MRTPDFPIHNHSSIICCNRPVLHSQPKYRRILICFLLIRLFRPFWISYFHHILQEEILPLKLLFQSLNVFSKFHSFTCNQFLKKIDCLLAHLHLVHFKWCAIPLLVINFRRKLITYLLFKYSNTLSIPALSNSFRKLLYSVSKSPVNIFPL